MKRIVSEDTASDSYWVAQLGRKPNPPSMQILLDVHAVNKVLPLAPDAQIFPEAQTATLSVAHCVAPRYLTNQE